MGAALSFLLAGLLVWLWHARARGLVARFAAMLGAAAQATIGIWQLAGGDARPLVLVLMPAVTCAAALAAFWPVRQRR